MNLELMGALNELEKERGISREVLIKAIEDAIHSALRRSAEPHQNLRVDFDDRSGKVRVFARKAVVRHVTDPANEIALEEAQRINPRFEVDDVVEVELTLPDLGRIAAQTAKQVVVQRIREAERSRIYDEYHSREGDIITGIIRRIEHRNVYVDLGRTEAVLPPQEQVPTERYAPGVRMKFCLVEVRKTTKGPQVILSRSHPALLKRLFELEVPEIHDGIVEIKAWAREPGHRSKIAVWSTDRNVDPVGACVGPRGARVQQVVKELRQEKVDVIAWDPDTEVFIANALSPARVLKVYLDPQERAARVIVPDMQLSLAIGKEGQNARLAAKLTGWRIDIKSEAQWAEVEREFEEKRRQAAERAVAAPAEPATEAREAPAAVAPAPAALAAVQAPAAPPAQPGAAVPEAEEEAPEPVAPPERVEIDEGPHAKGKGVGKVRRVKGARRLERRHLEEELEEAEALPSLFDEPDEAEEAEGGTAAGQVDGRERPAATSGAVRLAGGGLSVRLEDFLARKLAAAERRKPEGDATPAEVRREQPPAAAKPREASAPQQVAEASPKPQAPPSVSAAERTAPVPSTGGSPREPRAEAAPAARAVPADSGKKADGPRRPEAQEERPKKGKVLKSLAELAFEDFGFERPASKGKGKG